MTDIHRRQ